MKNNPNIIFYTLLVLNMQGEWIMQILYCDVIFGMAIDARNGQYGLLLLLCILAKK